MSSPSPSPPSSPDPKKLKISASDPDEPSNDPTAAAAPSDAVAGGADPAPRRRFKRCKAALILGYCGAGYQGMQKNPGARTIEGDLEEALFLAGAVSAADRGLPRRYDWARAARTDKGVSAAAQVVSGRFYLDPPGLAARLNEHLSPQIRVFGHVRATKSFNAKKFCDRRRYVYLLPVFALDPSAHPDREAVIASSGSGKELARCLECSERGRKVPGVMGRPMKRFETGDSGASEQCNTEDGAHLGDIPRFEGENVELGLANAESSGLCHIADATSRQSNSEGMDAAKQCPIQDGADFGLTSRNDVENVEHGLNNADAATRPPDGGGVDAVVQKGAEPGVISTIDAKNSNFGLKNAEVPELSGNGNTSNQTSEYTGQSTEIGTELPSQGCGEFVKTQVVDKHGELPTKGGFSYENEVKEKFNRILNNHVGTHNFHNFTTRTKAEDPSAKRYIISFTADQVVSIDGIEFIKCVVIGQSFMLHQIRKMIGLAVAVMRNCASESIYEVAFRKDININIPTAPEVGLYLDECCFTSYNKKWKDSHEPVSIDAFAEEAEEFRATYIHPHIAAMEHKEGAVALWLHSLNHRNYPDLCSTKASERDFTTESTETQQLVANSES